MKKDSESSLRLKFMKFSEYFKNKPEIEILKRETAKLSVCSMLVTFLQDVMML